MTDDTLPYNFCYGSSIPASGLQNSRIKLAPFDPSRHAEEFFNQSGSQSQIYEYLPFGAFSSTEDFLQKLWYGRIEPNPECMLFAIIDKSWPPKDSSIDEDGVMAGIIGFLDTQPANLSTEIGFVIIHPAFRRAHIASNSVSLLLHFALDLPEDGGLGLRRVGWKAHELNQSSVGVAKRLGFNHEGTMKWAMVLPKDGKQGNGIQARRGDPKPDTVGRNTWLGSVCWDDWIYGGVKEHVDGLTNGT
ncbi:acyl-CoA N-acyltransferase [Flagelloscypha sp. PMI_526]|nr:acyl-CoA N-acyltransferase [Flagelloscypha sp. PMI_526]